MLSLQGTYSPSLFLSLKELILSQVFSDYGLDEVLLELLDFI